MSTYFRPSVANTSLKSTALAPFGPSGVIDASLYTNDAWTFSPAVATLSATTVSGTAGTVTGSGYSAACTDAASGAWLAQTSGPLVHIVSGGTTSSVATALSKTFRGLTYETAEAAPYLVASDGSVYAVSGTAQAVTSGFGQTPCIGLDSSGTTLFTLQPAQAQIGFLTLASLTTGTSGFSGTPMTVPSCLAASPTASAVAVGGWNFAALSSGFTSMALEPLNGLALLGAAPASGAVAAYGNTSNSWAWTSSVTGLSLPAHVAWVPNGLRALACDPTSGKVYAFNYSLGTLTLAQTIVLSNAAASAVDPNSVNALVCRTASNVLTPLTFSGSTWTSGATIAIGSPSSILSTGASGMVVGCSSGLALAALNVSGVWALGATGSVGGAFIPSSLFLDTSGNIYSAGTAIGSGYWAISTSGLSLTASGSFTGSASGIIFLQGQTAVVDATSGVVRMFGPNGSTYTQQNTIAGPSGLRSISMNIFIGGEQAVFLSGGLATWQEDWTAPYTLARTPVGEVSIYHSGAWTSANLPTTIQPEAISWDPSGNVSVATLNNVLYTFTSGAVQSSSGTIAQFTGQPQSVPIGISALVWKSGHLYGSSSLNDSIVQVV